MGIHPHITDVWKNMSEAIKTIRVEIRGLVQGVYYRSWTVHRASELGLIGWVRNRLDGSVEAVFHGPSAALDRMLAECARGPEDAIVEKVAAEPYDMVPERGFSQLPTV
jgi:acylphosphatase